MFRNYLTVAIRNLLRHKVYSAINILGLVVGMACEHRAYLNEVHPGFSGESWLLRSFEAEATPRSAVPDLADPIGCDVETYRRQFTLIRRCVDHLVTYLQHAGVGVGHE